MESQERDRETDITTIRSFLGDGPERVKFEKVLGESSAPAAPTGNLNAAKAMETTVDNVNTTTAAWQTEH